MKKLLESGGQIQIAALHSPPLLVLGTARRRCLLPNLRPIKGRKERNNKAKVGRATVTLAFPSENKPIFGKFRGKEGVEMPQTKWRMQMQRRLSVRELFCITASINRKEIADFSHQRQHFLKPMGRFKPNRPIDPISTQFPRSVLYAQYPPY
jgi:hypothetical protein